MFPMPDQLTVFPHFLHAVVRHAVHYTVFVRHLEAEVAIRLRSHLEERHLHQFVALMIEVADPELAAPELRVPVDAAQQLVQRDHGFLSDLAARSRPDLRHCLQHRLQQLPTARHRLDLHPLAGRVRAADVGTEGDHVQLRVAGGEQAAFQPGVDHLQGCGLAELLLCTRAGTTRAGSMTGSGSSPDTRRPSMRAGRGLRRARSVCRPAHPRGRHAANAPCMSRGKRPVRGSPRPGCPRYPPRRERHRSCARPRLRSCRERRAGVPGRCA